MIICPSCHHSNPDGALNCEACFTPLPIVTMIECPSCHGNVLSSAKFCGHCGYNLTSPSHDVDNTNGNIIGDVDIGELEIDLNEEAHLASASLSKTNLPLPNISPISPNSMSNLSSQDFSAAANPDSNGETTGADLSANEELPTTPKVLETAQAGLFGNYEESSGYAKTQLQQVSASLLHVQTNLELEIPVSLPVVHIGKPNNVIPPDIDVSGFPDSDIVSRIHADIRIEGGYFYFEDTGSSNGTYINNLPLAAGNRHKLRHGDRISLGKGDKVSFIFQLKN
ncbi:MAG: FHA domain-containing protein [Pseudanabaenaceae cyanobacterium bins.39]|nr:FHA domain-containing protein [Pseudanabaenaceae cyanobacterium bins.39]